VEGWAVRTFNIHEAKTHLSLLVDQAANGEPFAIAKGGKPLVKVVPLNAPEARQIKRIGFLAGQIDVPDDFDTMGRERVLELMGTLEWDADYDYKKERSRR
jgi:prevent-host-death family protein